MGDGNCQDKAISARVIQAVARGRLERTIDPGRHERRLTAYKAWTPPTTLRVYSRLCFEAMQRRQSLGTSKAPPWFALVLKVGELIDEAGWLCFLLDCSLLDSGLTIDGAVTLFRQLAFTAAKAVEKAVRDRLESRPTKDSVARALETLRLDAHVKNAVMTALPSEEEEEQQRQRKASELLLPPAGTSSKKNRGPGSQSRRRKAAPSLTASSVGKLVAEHTAKEAYADHLVIDVEAFEKLLVSVADAHAAYCAPPPTLDNTSVEEASSLASPSWMSSLNASGGGGSHRGSNGGGHHHGHHGHHGHHHHGNHHRGGSIQSSKKKYMLQIAEMEKNSRDYQQKQTKRQAELGVPRAYWKQQGLQLGPLQELWWDRVAIDVADISSTGTISYGSYLGELLSMQRVRDVTCRYAPFARQLFNRFSTNDPSNCPPGRPPPPPPPPTPSTGSSSNNNTTAPPPPPPPPPARTMDFRGFISALTELDLHPHEIGNDALNEYSLTRLFWRSRGGTRCEVRHVKCDYSGSLRTRCSLCGRNRYDLHQATLRRLRQEFTKHAAAGSNKSIINGKQQQTRRRSNASLGVGVASAFPPRHSEEDEMLLHQFGNNLSGGGGDFGSSSSDDDDDDDDDDDCSSQRSSTNDMMSNNPKRRKSFVPAAAADADLFGEELPVDVATVVIEDYQKEPCARSLPGLERYYAGKQLAMVRLMPITAKEPARASLSSASSKKKPTVKKNKAEEEPTVKLPERVVTWAQFSLGVSLGARFATQVERTRLNLSEFVVALIMTAQLQSAETVGKMMANDNETTCQPAVRILRLFTLARRCPLVGSMPVLEHYAETYEQALASAFKVKRRTAPWLRISIRDRCLQSTRRCLHEQLHATFREYLSLGTLDLREQMRICMETFLLFVNDTSLYQALGYGDFKWLMQAELGLSSTSEFTLGQFVALNEACILEDYVLARELRICDAHCDESATDRLDDVDKSLGLHVEGITYRLKAFFQHYKLPHRQTNFKREVVRVYTASNVTGDGRATPRMEGIGHPNLGQGARVVIDQWSGGSISRVAYGSPTCFTTLSLPGRQFALGVNSNKSTAVEANSTDDMPPSMLLLQQSEDEEDLKEKPKKKHGAKEVKGSDSDSAKRGKKLRGKSVTDLTAKPPGQTDENEAALLLQGVVTTEFGVVVTPPCPMFSEMRLLIQDVAMPRAVVEVAPEQQSEASSVSSANSVARLSDLEDLEKVEKGAQALKWVNKPPVTTVEVALVKKDDASFEDKQRMEALRADFSRRKREEGATRQLSHSNYGYAHATTGVVCIMPATVHWRRIDAATAEALSKLEDVMTRRTKSAGRKKRAAANEATQEDEDEEEEEEGTKPLTTEELVLERENPWLCLSPRQYKAIHENKILQPLLAKAATHRFKKRCEQALVLAEQALAEARYIDSKSQTLKLQKSVLAVIVELCLGERFWAKAAVYVRRQLEVHDLLEKKKSPSSSCVKVRLLNELGKAEFAAGNLQAAVKAHEEQYALAEKTADLVGQMLADFNHARVLDAMGDNATALQRYTSVAKLSRDCEAHMVTIGALAAMSTIHLRSGSFDAARAVLEEKLGLLQAMAVAGGGHAHDLMADVVNTLAQLAECHRSSARHSEAYEILSHQLRSAKKLGGGENSSMERVVCGHLGQTLLASKLKVDIRLEPKYHVYASEDPAERSFFAKGILNSSDANFWKRGVLETTTVDVAGVCAQARVLFERQLELSLRLHEGRCSALENLVSTLTLNSQFEAAISIAEDCCLSQGAAGSDADAARLYGNLGHLFLRKAQPLKKTTKKRLVLLDRAAEAFETQFATLLPTEQWAKLAASRSFLGASLERGGRFSEALTAHLDQLKFAEKAPTNDEVLAASHLAVAHCASMDGDLDLAARHYSDYLSWATTRGDGPSQAAANWALSQIYSKRKMHDREQNHLNLLLNLGLETVDVNILGKARKRAAAIQTTCLDTNAHTLSDASLTDDDDPTPFEVTPSDSPSSPLLSPPENNNHHHEQSLNNNNHHPTEDK